MTAFRHRCLMIALLLAVSPAVARAEEAPLHERVDRLIEQRAGDHPLSGPADDAAFLRRAWLDLAGTIPIADDARAFLADDDPAKRAKLIDALLAGPHYARRMQELFHVILMERRDSNDDWAAYLRRSFEENKPWDRMAREILNPDPEDEATRGSAYFYVERLEKYGTNPVDYPGLTRDVGRLFAGQDLQCAQCHDHIYIDAFPQAHFQGLFAFFHDLKIRRADFPAVTEQVMDKPLDYQSVFKKIPKTTGPRAPGAEEIEVPKHEGDEQWLIKPDRGKKIEGVPRFSRLERLADSLATKDNPRFARNFVNRTWFVLMGRGLLEPLDLDHPGNPPSHPELLDLLAGEFVAHGFDIKWLLRQLMLTRTYQRSSVKPSGVSTDQPLPADLFVTAIERRLSAEQLMCSFLQATGELARVEAEEETWDALHERFHKAFANPPKEPEHEFAPALRGALFLMNDTKVNDLLQRRDGNLTDRLMKLDDPAAFADELYLSVLTREPTDEERSEVSAYLQKKADQREQAVVNLAWALLASTEFATNH